MSESSASETAPVHAARELQDRACYIHTICLSQESHPVKTRPHLDKHAAFDVSAVEDCVRVKEIAVISDGRKSRE